MDSQSFSPFITCFEASFDASDNSDGIELREDCVALSVILPFACCEFITPDAKNGLFAKVTIYYELTNIILCILISEPAVTRCKCRSVMYLFVVDYLMFSCCPVLGQLDTILHFHLGTSLRHSRF